MWVMNRLVWFRTDLRLLDNPTLSAAVDDAPGGVAYVYIFQPGRDEQNQQQPAVLGPQRLSFLAQSVLALKKNLQTQGADLLCLMGDPLTLLPDLCRQLQISDVYHSRLTAHNERQQERQLAQLLEKLQVRVHSYQTHTMICDEDADFDLYAPMSFSKLRKFVEKSWPIREPLPVPAQFPKALTFDHTPWDMHRVIVPTQDKRGIHLTGGEAAGLQRVHDYFWAVDQLQIYQDTRNGLRALNDSSKFSPWLNLGCLSARTVYQQVRHYEVQRVANYSTLWFLYELLWRDHFHFLAKKRGSLLFNDLPQNFIANADRHAFEKWRTGQTDSAFINAAMIELQQTGWLSNRMRQNAASYLIHDLKQDWRWGARWFETQLIDYDPCSNWGNWAYIAGADFSRKPHQFDVQQQARRYDANDEYTRSWNQD